MKVPPILSFLSSCGLLVGLASAAPVCNVRQYGAKGDGVIKDTIAIQRAIDDCAKRGGGTVQLEGGTFVSAPIVLRNHTRLDVAKGAVLLGSPDHGDYPAKVEFRSPGMQSLVSATGAEDVAITGGGTIDGNGESWWLEARNFKGFRHSRVRTHATTAGSVRPLPPRPDRRRDDSELADVAVGSI